MIDALSPAKPVTETITNGLFTLDRKWTVQYWNKAAEILVHLPAKEIIGKNIWKTFPAAVELPCYSACHQAFLQEAPIHLKEYWAELETWFDVVIYHHNDNLSISFKRISLLETRDDHPEQRTKIQNELYRFVTEVTNDCLWEWDFINHEIFWIDGGHKRVFGYQVENALVPQSFWEGCLHPDDRTRVITNLNILIAKNKALSWEEEYRFKKANGEYAYVHDRGHVICENGIIRRMIGATQDISARKHAEIKLLDIEKQLSLMARQTVNAIIITDASRKIIWVNSAFTLITGYTPEEVLGSAPGNLLYGKEMAVHTADYINKQMQQQEPFDCEISNESKTGVTYWMHLQGQALFDESGKCDRYFITQIDITEKKLLEDHLHKERQTRLTEITAAVLTAQENERAEIGKELHDNVNQILGATKLYIEMARAFKDHRDEYLEKSCAYIVEVIEEIRKISKTMTPQGLDIIGLVDSIKILLADLKQLLPLNTVFVEEGMQGLVMEPKLELNIFRIVQEQINNILKHADASSLEIHLSAEGKNIVLVMKDNGRGCNTAEKRKGVGITNITSRTALYRGKASIVSSPGNGFTLKVVLPLDAAA